MAPPRALLVLVGLAAAHGLALGRGGGMEAASLSFAHGTLSVPFTTPHPLPLSSLTPRVLLDATGTGAVLVSGAGRHSFLHNMATNAFLPPPRDAVAEVRPACFTTATGRLLDYTRVVVGGEVSVVVTSPAAGARLTAHMSKFIFPLDEVVVEDRSEGLDTLVLVGPEEEWGAMLQEQLELRAPPRSSAAVSGAPGDAGSCVVVHGTDMALPGFTVLAWRDAEGGSPLDGLRGAAEGAGVPLGGWRELDALRIAQGRPLSGREITDQANPLEVGLFHSVSFTKGCYLGQESISKVNNAKGGRQFIYGLRLSAPPAAPLPLSLRDPATGGLAGRLTSLSPSTEAPAGLGLVRKASAEVGRILDVEGGEGITAEVVDVPFPTRTDAQSAGPPPASENKAESAVDAAQAADRKAAKEAEAARKAAKMAAVQAKIDALKARKAAGNGGAGGSSSA